MIHYLKVSNFYSIKEPQEMDLVIAKNVPDLPDRFTRPIPGSDVRIPKVVALFGPNASGKTTVLRAIVFLQWFLRDSFNLAVDAFLPFVPFASQEGWHNTTEFAVEFDAQLIEEQPRCLYRYELSIQNANEVIFERLTYAPQGRSRRIFERDKTEIRFGKEFQVRRNDPRRETIRSNTSVISTFAKFAHPLSVRIVQGLGALQTNLFIRKIDFPEEDATKYYSEHPNILDLLSSQVQTFDLGIENVQVQLVKDKMIALFKHTGLDAPLGLENESDGTRNFYSLFPYLEYVLRIGGIAVLDEFDNVIHPLLLPELTRWFYTSKNNAQLIISVHNATLLESLEKEEVFFTEKNNQGQTEIYGLKNIRGVRRDTNIYSNYLGRAFGAVPHIG